jgi:hypothetical protein
VHAADPRRTTQGDAMQSFLRRPSRRAAIVAGAAGLAVVGAVGFGAAAFADGTRPSPGTTQAPTAAPSGAHGHGPGGTHAPHIGGTVQSVVGSTVTVKDRDGFTRTITLASGVKVTKDGSSSSAGAITKGTWIEATGAVDSNGTTLDATTVTIGMRSLPKDGSRGDRPAPHAGEERAATPPATPSAS